MKPLLLGYAACDTSRRARRWLEAQGTKFAARDIVRERPTADELRTWIARSGLPASKFFNTSGVRYKELGLKEVVRNAPDEELIHLLTSDGKLVKRPLLVGDEWVLVGFREAEWAERLK